MKKNFVIYLAGALLASACVYPYDADITSSVEKELVVDANILLGSTSTITLTYLQSLDADRQSSSTGYPVATVYLEDEAGNKYDAEGYIHTYTLNIPEGNAGKYRLTVICDSKTYRSEWVEPVQPPVLKDISFQADDYNVMVKLDMEDKGSGSGYAAVQFDEIWRFHTDYIRSYDYDPLKGTVNALPRPIDIHYWCWYKKNTQTIFLIDYSSMNSVVNGYVLNTFSRADMRNHQEYHIRVKLWNLTPEQYRYRKLLEENASIGGNLFSPEPGEVRGNVFCESDPDARVFGYVNVSAIAQTEKTLDDRYNKWTISTILDVPDPEDYQSLYERGYMPVDNVLGSNGNLGVGWGLARCYDCIEAGGTLEKPDFD